MAVSSFVVETDRRVINRLYRVVLGLHGGLLVLIMGLIALVAHLTRGMSGGALTFTPFLILVAGQTFQIAYYCYIWGGRAAVSQPLTISTIGLAANTPAGSLAVPWEAIVSVRRISVLTNAALRIDFHPSAGPGSPGVITTASKGYWRRLRRGGLRVGAKGLTVPLGQIEQAIRQLSGGRIPIS